SEIRPGAGPFSSLKLTATYTDYDHEEIESGGSLGTSFAQQVTTAELLARGGDEGSRRQTAVGARWQYRNIETGGTLRTPSTYDNSAALFAVEEASFGRARLQAGARYDFARYVPYARNHGITINGRTIETGPRSFGSFSGSVGTLVDVTTSVKVGANV